MIENILLSVSILFLLTTGALVSEYCGILAVFLDGIINLSAFLFYLFLTLSNNVFFAFCLAITTTCSLTFLISLFTEKFNANPFITGLALNLFCQGIITLLSNIVFKTQGVLTNIEIFTNTRIYRLSGIILCFIFSLIILLILKKTKYGLHTQIVGYNGKILTSQKIDVKKLKIISWIIAAFCASFVGCILTGRFSSFVPNISSGQGWIALAAVFLAQKRISRIIIADLLFAISIYISSVLQGTMSYSNISPTMLLSLPYLIVLLFFVFSKQEKDIHEE